MKLSSQPPVTQMPVGETWYKSWRDERLLLEWLETDLQTSDVSVQPFQKQGRVSVEDSVNEGQGTGE